MQSSVLTPGAPILATIASVDSPLIDLPSTPSMKSPPAMPSVAAFDPGVTASTIAPDEVAAIWMPSAAIVGVASAEAEGAETKWLLAGGVPSSGVASVGAGGVDGGVGADGNGRGAASTGGGGTVADGTAADGAGVGAVATGACSGAGATTGEGAGMAAAGGIAGVGAAVAAAS